MTANGFIRRGPMAADIFERQFTQVHNAVFRDRRMSFKAKGIFGLISTHRDGFGLSIEALVSSGTDGTSAVRTGLNELEAFGYLRRDQSRLDGPTQEQPKARKGSFGPVEYYITDMPDGLVVTIPPPHSSVGCPDVPTPSCENRTTEKMPRPAPLCDIPQTDKPHAVQQQRKKTKTKNTLSPPAPPAPPRTAVPAQPPSAAHVSHQAAPAPSRPSRITTLATHAQAAAVAQALAARWKETHGTRPGRRQLAQITAEADDALADGDSPTWLLHTVVPFMTDRGYLDLGRARTHRQCPRPQPPAPAPPADQTARLTALGIQSSGL
ncbi:hypothetical protein AB0H73_39895 [Streptomyces olivoreticuli]